MTLRSFIATHATCGIQELTRFNVDPEVLSRQLLSRPDLVAGCVVLSTCNRTEVYVDVAELRFESETIHYVYSVLATLTSTSETDVRAVFTVHDEKGAFEHLCEVASGVDSLILGDRQILGQVRKCLREACTTGTSSTALTKAFHIAIQAGKEVRKETQIVSTSRSLVDAALSKTSVSNWSQTVCLVIGTGAYAGISVRVLQQLGCENIFVYSHSGRAAAFAAHHDLAAVPQCALKRAISQADVIICCSGRGQVITVDMLKQVLGTRKVPLSLVDLSLPHDIEPEVRTLPSVELINLTDLETCPEASTRQDVESAKKIIARHLSCAFPLPSGKQVNEAITCFRENAYAILEKENERLPATLSNEEAQYALKRLTNSLLHTPCSQVRKLQAKGRGDEALEGFEALFGLRLN